MATPSGRPEATFAGQDPAEVSARIAGMCLDRGHVVTEAGSAAVVCRRDMSTFQATMLQFLIANGYSSTPDLYVRFTLIPTPAGTRVQAYQWVESTMAFGQRRTLEINGPVERNAIQAALSDLASVPAQAAAIVAAPAATPADAPAPPRAPSSVVRPAASGVVKLPMLPKS